MLLFNLYIVKIEDVHLFSPPYIDGENLVVLSLVKKLVYPISTKLLSEAQYCVYVQSKLLLCRSSVVSNPGYVYENKGKM